MLSDLFILAIVIVWLGIAIQIHTILTEITADELECNFGRESPILQFVFVITWPIWVIPAAIRYRGKSTL